MKLKQEKALTGVDLIIGILAIMIFFTLIGSMMSNNGVENAKLRKETLAMIYMTEIFEKIGIMDYEQINGGTEEELKSLLLPDYVTNDYTVELKITNKLYEDEGEQSEINNEIGLIKVKLTLSYTIANKNYTCYMERMKIKE